MEQLTNTYNKKFKKKESFQLAVQGTSIYGTDMICEEDELRYNDAEYDEDVEKEIAALVRRAQEKRHEDKHANSRLVIDKPGETWDLEDDFAPLQVAHTGFRLSAEERNKPKELKYFDIAHILVTAGDGGNGLSCFIHEKGVEFGGPGGGHGGHGGNVWAEAVGNKSSLGMFRDHNVYRAGPGGNGGNKCKEGKRGQDCIIPVPVGTIITADDAPPDSPPFAELLEVGQRALLMVGGQGGLGNRAFKSNLNKAPEYAEFGEKGRTRQFKLELRLVADVGIVGVPCSGKSSLLNAISNATPQCAPYPFTTIRPNIGVVEHDHLKKSFVCADLPGLVSGAHKGTALGLEFLRHATRCKALIHVIDGTSDDPVKDFITVNYELEQHSPELKRKPQIIVFNKMDLEDASVLYNEYKQQLVLNGVPSEIIYPVSTITKEGCDDVIAATQRLVDKLPCPQPLGNALNVTRVPDRKYGVGRRLRQFEIWRQRGATMDSTGRQIMVFTVVGRDIQRAVEMVNLRYFDGVKRLHSILENARVFRALKRAGIRSEDCVRIGKLEVFWNTMGSKEMLFELWEDARPVMQHLISSPVN